MHSGCVFKTMSFVARNNHTKGWRGSVELEHCQPSACGDETLLEARLCPSQLKNGSSLNKICQDLQGKPL